MKRLVLVVAAVAAVCAKSDDARPVATPPVSTVEVVELARKVEILWTAHTNRVARVERMRRDAEARNNGNGRPPVKPFKARRAK